MAKQKYYDVIIAGAGPSGMTAALYCSRKGLTVLLLDRNVQVGRKLLVTGNGRCNLTNEKQKMADYRSEDPELAWGMVRSFNEEKTMEYLRDLGICLTAREGYIYPYSGQAATVREAFEREVGREKRIRILTETRLLDMDIISAKEKNIDDSGLPVRFRVRTEKLAPSAPRTDRRSQPQSKEGKARSFSCSCLLLATGGYAGEIFGCHGDGFRLAQVAGHRMVRPLPALTALKTSAPFVKKLSGVRCPAEIRAEADHDLLARETGELQWTDYGISGVAVFQLSRHVIRALEDKKKVEVLINFLPGMDQKAMKELMVRAGGQKGERSLSDVFHGIFPSKLAGVLLRESRCGSEKNISHLSEREWEQISRAVLAFSLRISGYMGYEKAQTTQGGVPLHELTASLESMRQPGLFFAGELLDVDGTCGGYNLQWAFSSGHLAGEGIVRKCCLEIERK